MEAGYNLAEALGEAGQAVGNRAIRQGVRDLQNAIRRGEKFRPRAGGATAKRFPPIVSQLVIVGEQTGHADPSQQATLPAIICQREIERKTNIFVGHDRANADDRVGRRDRRDPACNLSADV